MRDTWYVLEDGSVADPSECAPDDNGRLRHKGGAAVAMRGDAYSSRGVDPDQERAKSEAKAKDMKPETQKGGYRTRDVKSG